MKKEKKDIIKDWEKRGAKYGVTLNQLAAIGGIDRTQLFRWRSGHPKAVTAYIEIEKHLAELEEIQSTAE